MGKAIVRMNLTSRLLLLLCASILTGCANLDPATMAIAFTGVVDSREEITRNQTSGGSAPRPFHSALGGAAGGLVDDAVNRSRNTPDYIMYTVRTPDGQLRTVATKADYTPGDCVAVKVPPDKVTQAAWKMGEVVFTPSNACGPSGSR